MLVAQANAAVLTLLEARQQSCRNASESPATVLSQRFGKPGNSLVATLQKAKAVQPYVEKLISLATKGDLHARRQAISTLQHPDKGVIYKLFEEIAPRYTERPGGYTRILKLGPRHGDNAPMARIELV